ncbi:type I secretion system permease/ATPase [Sphingomonas limnosediminicola]|uniref:Type I secretion system permease/ATPase n=1 Tax=Sphingomonas limnosediminicola TaxID=940133 RepID=A0ABP7KVC6_9SPHN
MKILGQEVPKVLADALADCRRHFMAAAIFSLLINILYLAPTIYMLQVYDRVVPTAGKTTLLFITMALALSLLTLSILDMVRNRLLVRASQRMDALIAPRILRQMMATDSASAGQAMRDFDSVRTAMATPAIAAIFDFPWTPVFLLVAFMLHFWIGIMAIISAILLVSVAFANQRATQKSMEIATTAMVSAANSQQAAATHGTTVKALGMTGAMVERQLGHRRIGLANMLHAQFAGSRLTATSKFLRMFVQSAALGLGALLAIAGDISAGAIIASSVLLSRALQPIESIIGAWASLAAARSAIRRLNKSFETLEEPRIYTALPDPEGVLEVEEVGVRGRDGRTILVGLTFRADPGSILGIIGPSGSGKTTLGRIIVGAAQPTIGTVRIDGARLTDWDQDDLGRHIGYMPQEPSLFDGTLKENISRFERPSNVDDAKRIDEAVVKAAKEAGVHELVLQLPQGYDTPLGLMGAGLSAGQAQRVALARALYGDPKLIVLDEPNAFLDQAGETSLIAAIAKARARKATVIVIAHRQGVLAAVDRLLVMEEGRPKLIGPAKDVVARLTGPKRAENAA